MRALLAGQLLALESDDPGLLAAWGNLFELEIARAAGTAAELAPDIVLKGRIGTPASPPEGTPQYDEAVPHHGNRRIRYFERPNGGILDLARPAQVQYDFEALCAEIFLEEQLLERGHLEDISNVAVAPLLRRRGIQIIHAFTVARESAVLLCGKSGSGKTTTGLALVESGWSYLANDATLLSREDGTYLANASHGAINTFPDSLALVPHLAARLSLPDNPPGGWKYELSRTELFTEDELGNAAPIQAILFPTRSSSAECHLSAVPAAVALARMLEQDVDQWDTDTYLAHLDFLTGLFDRVPSYDLHIPEGGLREAGTLVDRQFGS